MNFFFYHSEIHAKRTINAAASGQALTEFLVLAFALVPLFLLIPIIAKYQDIAHSTQMASRYAAFEAMTRNDGYGTWKPVNQLAGEVRRRFFSNPDAPVKTNDIAGKFKAHQNLFWRDPKNASLIPDLDSGVNISFGFANAADHTGAFSSASDGGPFDLKNQLSLAAHGIYTANVTVKLVDLPAGLQFYEPFDKIKLVMQRSTSIVMDGWSGRDPASVQAKLDHPLLYPGSLLKPLSLVVDPLVWAAENMGSVPPPKLGQLDFWADVVPKDRLRPQ